MNTTEPHLQWLVEKKLYVYTLLRLAGSIEYFKKKFLTKTLPLLRPGFYYFSLPKSETHNSIPFQVKT